MPPTTAATQRIKSRLLDALLDPPPGGYSRTALIRKATGDYKAGGVVLDGLIADGTITKNSDNVLELANPQPEVESSTAESSVWDDRMDEYERDMEILTKRLTGLAGQVSTVEAAIKEFGQQLVELASTVGKLAEVVAALADDRSNPEQPATESTNGQAALLDLTPAGQTVLDRMSPEQRARAEEHLAKYAPAAVGGTPGEDANFWFADEPASTESFWA